jgi:multiple sugar transport system permease protein
LTLFLDQHAQEWALLMAASTVTLLPVIVIFFFAQRTFIEGISLTGIKG